MSGKIFRKKHFFFIKDLKKTACGIILCEIAGVLCSFFGGTSIPPPAQNRVLLRTKTSLVCMASRSIPVFPGGDGYASFVV
jgi:hypothetical protein